MEITAVWGKPHMASELHGFVVEIGKIRKDSLRRNVNQFDRVMHRVRRHGQDFGRAVEAKARYLRLQVLEHFNGRGLGLVQARGVVEVHDPAEGAAGDSPVVIGNCNRRALKTTLKKRIK